MTDETEDPGASGEAHGASEDVLADASDNTENDNIQQDGFRSYRDYLICNRSSVCLFGGGTCAYCKVPDRALSDEAVGVVMVREAVFLCLVSLVESLVGGWPVDINRRVSWELSNLQHHYGDILNLDLVEELFLETLERENAFENWDLIEAGTPYEN